MRNKFCKRIIPLALSLALVTGLLAVPAAAAPASPTGELANVAYYGGSYTNCKMPYDMANAYVKALDAVAGSGMLAVLADPAGDGMPLLLTVASRSTADLADTLKVWTWNGISANPYDFVADTELGWTFGYDFGTYDGKEAALRVGDGVGLAVGDACGYSYYAVENGQLSPIRHTMMYTADAWNSSTASGRLLPLVNANGTLYNQTAPVSALVNAGWTKIDGYNAYQLVSVDGQYKFFDTYAAQDSWLAADNARFTASKSQLIEVTTGESYLLGHWTDGALMRAALAAYAQKAATNNGDFFDVPTSHWAYDTVKWAVDRGITNGTSATSFSPNSTCTKAQILTFLWRAKGEPAAGNTNPFQESPSRPTTTSPPCGPGTKAWPQALSSSRIPPAPVPRRSIISGSWQVRRTSPAQRTSKTFPATRPMPRPSSGRCSRRSRTVPPSRPSPLWTPAPEPRS